MTKTIPHYLRVHHETASNQNVQTKAPLAKDSVNDFWHAYNEATGWRIDAGNGSPSIKARVQLQAAPGNANSRDTSETKNNTPLVNKLSAQRLADSATALAQQLADAHETIRIQNAELAARCSVVPESSQRALADRLSDSLADMVTAMKCDAAAIYLLDDDTENLTMRSMHGLPDNRLAAPPRQLQGSRGDLEAMVQGVVMISDLHELSFDTWSCPENASSAACASLVSSGVPIGTLWFYFSEQQSLEDSHAAIAQLAANQIAMQLQSASSDSSLQTTTPDHNVDDLAQWQFAGLPMGTLLAPDWRVDGMIESPQPWATGWHAWDVLPDGTLMIAIAEAEDKSIAGSMSAAIARAALESHTGYRHTPEQLLQRVSDTLWQTNTMDQLTSLMYVRINPETGEGEIASAGSMIAMIAGRYGYRPAIAPNDSPLASRIDLNCTATTFRMSAGEVLMAYGDGFGGDGIDQTTIGNQLRQAMQASDNCPLASVRRHLVDQPMNHERGAVTILRQ
ncbi:SpoIIE family protein phosphatase [Planctomycetes bacterium K23_9]|uniref:Stage II sporulation protein E (SpoIIE) n=1 Tax=Stieleria marina TaxID=1930275 RepID=A0A517NS82_9BACT|nr:Stage II sporulation protein E (SpoIIE) [Planctomycetes bacterium K23_9]